jgi:hypothetical protein
LASPNLAAREIMWTVVENAFRIDAIEIREISSECQGEGIEIHVVRK